MRGSTDLLSVIDPFKGDEDFHIIIDAPYLAIVYIEGRIRGHVLKSPLHFAVMQEVAKGHGLIVDEVADPGCGSLEITFRVCGETNRKDQQH